jgi:hypothetical protein
LEQHSHGWISGSVQQHVSLPDRHTVMVSLHVKSCADAGEASNSSSSSVAEATVATIIVVVVVVEKNTEQQ